MKTVLIETFSQQVNWDQIEPITIDTYPWYTEGLKQGTQVQLARLEDALCLRVKAFDVHCLGTVLEANGPVYQDSCFEFFFRPEHEMNEHYINLEINCIGTVYLAVRNALGKRRATPDELKHIQVVTSLDFGKVKVPEADDALWTLDIRIPFDFIRTFYGTLNRDVWQGNFYRCGGAVEDQYAVWNPVVAPKPDFHQPTQFGRLIFVN